MRGVSLEQTTVSRPQPGFHIATVKLVENKYGSQLSGVVSASLESISDLGQATMVLGRLDFVNMAVGVLNGTKRREDSPRAFRVT